MALSRRGQSCRRSLRHIEISNTPDRGGLKRAAFEPKAARGPVEVTGAGRGGAVLGLRAGGAAVPFIEEG